MELSNVRAKLRRATDGALSQGWVVGQRDTSFLVNTTTDIEISPGDPFVCEFYALEWTVTSLAVARFVNAKPIDESGAHEVTVALEQVRTVSVSRGKGNERVLVEGFTASLWSGSGRMATGCSVRDISKKGLAVIAPDPVEPETEVNVVVEGGDEPLTLTCVVKYCRSTKDGHRVGLHALGTDRLTGAKWSQLVSDRKKHKPAA